MTYFKLKPIIPYIGLPVLGTALLIFRANELHGLVLLWCALLIIFGYIVSVFDLKTKTIPNRIILTMLAAWALTIIPLLFYDTSAAVILLIDSALGFLISGGLFILVYIISRKGLGGGDVKFMATAGLYLGFGGVIPAMFCGSIFAALIAVGLLLFKRINRKDTIPLAPFLYIGMLITIFLL